VTPLPESTQAQLRTLDLPPGASVGNPVDIPANVLQRENGSLAAQIIDRIFEDARPDAFVIHVNVPVILGYTHVDILGQLIEATLAARARAPHPAHVVLVLRSDGEAEIESRKAALRSRALEAGIAVFDELDIAARALAGLRPFEATSDSAPLGRPPIAALQGDFR
jgi:acyl-CoA synthetase (NDP forming)